MSIPDYYPDNEPDYPRGFRPDECLECGREFLASGAVITLHHCDHCRPAYIASRAYLHKYAVRVRGGWLPDRFTPAPMTPEPVHEAWITAGDLADFNSDPVINWQRARIVPHLHGMEILAAFRWGTAFQDSSVVVLLCGHQHPISYFAVDARARLDVWMPSARVDEWPPRKHAPAQPMRNWCYDAAFLYGKVSPAEIAGNDGVNPIRLTVTYFHGDTRLATASCTYKRSLGQRGIKVLAFHDVTLTLDPATMWGYTDALREMAAHLGSLAKAGKGW